MKRKIKIAVITWLFPKISETFILNQITFLIEQGFDVKIFAIKDTRKNTPKEDFESEKNIHPLVNKYKLFSRTIYFPIDKLPDYLSKETKAGNIDILYFQFSDLASKVLKKKEFDIPVITVIHDLPKIQLRSFKKVISKFKTALTKATLILAISEFTKNELLKLGCPSNKIIVHPMGVDSKIFTLRKNKFPKSLIRFSMIGRFVHKKGFDIGIKAIKEVKNKNPRLNIALNLIGDGLLQPKVESLVRKLSLEQEVKFLGKLTQPEVMKVLKNTDILLCPSVTTREGKREGLPVVLIEASFVGIPIVATAHAAIPEFAAKNNSVVLVKEKSVNQLVLAIEKVLKSYNIYYSLARKNRKHLVEKYGIDNLGRRLIKIFELAEEINNIEKQLQFFTRDLKESLGHQVACAFIVGSVARREKVSEFSDIDMVIIFSGKYKISSKTLLNLRWLIKDLENKLNISITPQVFNEFDFVQMVSPVLLKEYLLDNKIFLGSSLLRKIKMPKIKNLEMAILKRMLFQRYLMRQKITTSPISLKMKYDLAKTSLFLAKYFIWIEKREYLTHRADIIKFFEKESRHYRLIADIDKVLSKPQEIRSRNINRDFINFIEKICEEVIKILQRRYQIIYVRPF